MSSSLQKKRYRSPTASASVEISLDEFSVEEMRAEIAHREGADCEDMGEGIEIPAILIATMSTLILCGQRESALQELCRKLEPHVGRLLP